MEPLRAAHPSEETRPYNFLHLYVERFFPQAKVEFFNGAESYRLIDSSTGEEIDAIPNEYRDSPGWKAYYTPNFGYVNELFRWEHRTPIAPIVGLNAPHDHFKLEVIEDPAALVRKYDDVAAVEWGRKVFFDAAMIKAGFDLDDFYENSRFYADLSTEDKRIFDKINKESQNNFGLNFAYDYRTHGFKIVKR